jgi:hypothetical protein
MLQGYSGSWAGYSALSRSAAMEIRDISSSASASNLLDSDISASSVSRRSRSYAAALPAITTFRSEAGNKSYVTALSPHGGKRDLGRGH